MTVIECPGEHGTLPIVRSRKVEMTQDEKKITSLRFFLHSASSASLHCILPMNFFPSDALSEILSFLTAEKLNSLSTLNHQFYSVVRRIVAKKLIEGYVTFVDADKSVFLYQLDVAYYAHALEIEDPDPGEEQAEVTCSRVRVDFAAVGGSIQVLLRDVTDAACRATETRKLIRGSQLNQLATKFVPILFSDNELFDFSSLQARVEKGVLLLRGSKCRVDEQSRACAGILLLSRRPRVELPRLAISVDL